MYNIAKVMTPKMSERYAYTNSK